MSVELKCHRAGAVLEKERKKAGGIREVRGGKWEKNIEQVRKGI